MSNFSSSVMLGLCLGFLWGIGCSLVIVYSVYLAGYRKAVKESLKPVQPQRYLDVFASVQARRERKVAKKMAKKDGLGGADPTPAGAGPESGDLQVDETAQKENPKT
jgi:hypothetical protein